MVIFGIDLIRDIVGSYLLQTRTLHPSLPIISELPTRKQSDRIWIAAAKLPGGDPPNAQLSNLVV
jgi:hypothetical protein